MKNRGFNLIHVSDLVKRIRAKIEVCRRYGDEAGAKALEDFLKEFE